MQFRYILLSLAILAFSLTANAQKVKRKGVEPNQLSKKGPVAKYSLEQLSGKWQEVKRSALADSVPIHFSDSLLMHFENGKVELKDATSMRMTVKGEATIEAPTTLLVAGDNYSIKYLDKNKLVISDEEFTREFEKKEQYYYETVGKLQVSRESFTHTINVDLKNLKGKWLVYRRQATPGTITPATAVIKSIDISNITSDSTATGQVVFYTTDISETAVCTLTLKADRMQILADKYSWNLDTYKADITEFVFGNTAGLLYYSKRL